MAHDRMHRASMRYSEKVNSWPIQLRFFWSELWGYCDDFGRGRYDNRLIVADTFPLDEEVTAAVVGRWMKALEQSGVIVPYEVDDKRYFECVNWDEHQELPYRKKTTIPDHSGAIPTPGKYSGKFQKVLSKGEGDREGEIEGEGESTQAGAPPLYCKKHPNGTDGPCRACGDARRAHAAWKEPVKPTLSGIVTDPDCPKHPHRPLRGCDRCAEEARQT